MDSLLDNLIFLIPVAIFIGRIVTAAKRGNGKKSAQKRPPPPEWPATRPARPEQQRTRVSPPPRPKQPARLPGPPVPEISIHFEDDDDVEFAESVQSVPAYSGAPVLRPPVIPRPAVSASAMPSMMPPEVPRPKASAVPAAAAPDRTGFPLNLNYLSPLKQAVVMAEVLGPPKGLL